MANLKRKYTITFLNLKTKLEVTYYNNHFKAFEYKAGGISEKLMRAIGTVIPLNESAIKAKLEEHKGKIKIELIKNAKPATQHTQFLDRYISFFTERNSISPKINGTEQNALKRIIVYLMKESNSPEEAFEVWEYLFNSWDNLEEFFKKQQLLRNIDSNLTNLLTQIKNGTNNSNGTQAPTSESMATAFLKRYGSQSASS